MFFLRFHLLILAISLVDASTTGGGRTVVPPPSNDLGLIFGHQANRRENNVVIYFDVTNSTLKEYRYYYYDFRPFGSYNSHIEYLPRQRLRDTHNSLRIIGLHDGDYVVCLSFVDEYETISKPRYACYEFTLGEKIVGSHHGGSSGYLAPLLFAIAFVIHVIIAVVHHIKEKNYGNKLLRRFMNVTPKSGRRRINVDQSLRELDRELDHPHLPASVQRRLSRVTVDANLENGSHHRGSFLVDNPTDELPLYTLPHHSTRGISNTLDSVSSMRHLMDTAPWKRHSNQSAESSVRTRSHMHV